MSPTLSTRDGKPVLALGTPGSYGIMQTQAQAMVQHLVYGLPLQEAIEAAWPGTRSLAFGHLGDGNVHFHVLAPQGVEARAWDRGDGQAISRQVHDLVTAWGGSISAEHGIGRSKRDELARLGDPVALGILRSVKQALDPQGLLNPGKLVAPAAADA
jgi:FAD/FMN-containing dehydrogenase